MRSQKDTAIAHPRRFAKTLGQKIKIYLALLLPFYFLLLPLKAVAAEVRLGVVRSQENSTQWGGITTRLNASGISYCVVDWQNVRTAADLASSTVLFLPNVEKLTQEQALALETWMSKGGRIIATGPVGNLSAPGVRQMLRSLLGAYWAFPMSEAVMLQPLRTRTQEWVRRELAGTIHGGVVIPTGLNSQTAATWSGPEDPPAIVTTNRVTFFGWRWGVDAAATADLDRAWLEAAIARYGKISPTLTASTQTANNCLAPGASTVATAARTSSTQRSNSSTRSLGTPAAAAPRPTGTAPNSTAQSAAPIRAAVTQPTSTPAILPGTAIGPAIAVGASQPISTSRDAINRVSTAPGMIRDNQRSMPNAPTTADPTERVAAAGITIKPNMEIISSAEAIAMRQELENLLGRVESAMLAADAVNFQVAKQESQFVVGEQRSSLAGERVSRSIVGEPEGSKNDTAATSAANLAATSTIVASTSTLVNTQNSAMSTFQQAREVLQALPELIAQRDYASARAKWLQARQSLWNLYPIDRPSAQPEIRAVWLDRGTIVRARSQQGLARIFDRMAQAGINTVFIETVNAGYPIYPSQVAPEQNPLIRGWDPLADAVKLARDRGMELHAWVWVFAAGNQRHNALLNQPIDYLGPVLSAHPDWANYDNRGSAIPEGQTKPFLDPANPEVRRYLMQLFDEIVTRYQVDGIHLDYIRYPFQDQNRGATYGYGKAAREQFQQLTGVDPQTISPNDRVLWEKWLQFRTERVNSFVAEVSQMVRQRRSNLIVSAAVFAYPEQERIEKLQQNWEVWARRGDVDLIVPMAYAADTNRFQQLVQPWLTRRDLGSSLILPGIQLLSLPEVGAIDQIQLVRDLMSGGYSLFAMEHLSDRLQTIFTRTQGTLQRASVPPIPYRQPFAAAAARFTALTQEWDFLLGNNQLQLSDAARSSWRDRSDELSTALNKLAREPNAANLSAARNSLGKFRDRFRDWMRPHAGQNAYQVQTWDNRLASLELLLNYGERVVLNRQTASTTQQ